MAVSAGTYATYLFIWGAAARTKCRPGILHNLGALQSKHISVLFQLQLINGLWDCFECTASPERTRC